MRVLHIYLVIKKDGLNGGNICIYIIRIGVYDKDRNYNKDMNLA